MEMDRRQFLTNTIAGASGLLLGSRLGIAADAKPFNPFEVVPLSKTGLSFSRLGLGTGMRGGNRQTNHTRMGQEKFTALVRGAYERGIRWFDAADMYGTHPFLAKALKGIPRDQYRIVSKIWVRPGGLPEKERPGADVLVERFRKELDSDYIDLLLIHCMTDPKWTEQQKQQMDLMDNLKSKGLIKLHGVSVHSLDALKACIDCPWVDSVHARINAFGVAMDHKDPQVVADVLKQIHDKGKGVIGMKLVGEGKFGSDDQKKNESLKFVWKLGSMDIATVGFEKVEEIDDLAARMVKVMA